MLDVPMYRSPATYTEKEKYFLLQLLLQIKKSTKIVLFFCSFLVCLWCLLCVLLRCPLEDHTGWLMCPWATASTVGSTKSTFSLSSTLHPSTDILHVLTMEVVLPLAMAMSRYILSRDDSSPRIGKWQKEVIYNKTKKSIWAASCMLLCSNWPTGWATLPRPEKSTFLRKHQKVVFKISKNHIG